MQFSMATAKVHTYDSHADSHGSRAKSSGSQTTSAVAGSSASDAAGTATSAVAGSSASDLWSRPGRYVGTWGNRAWVFDDDAAAGCAGMAPLQSDEDWSVSVGAGAADEAKAAKEAGVAAKARAID